MWHERAEAAANGLIARAKGEDSLSAFSVPPELQQVFPALPSRIRIKLGKRRGLLIRRMNQTSESELNANETQLSPTSGSGSAGLERVLVDSTALQNNLKIFMGLGHDRNVH